MKIQVLCGLEEITSFFTIKFLKKIVMWTIFIFVIYYNHNDKRGYKQSNNQTIKQLYTPYKQLCQLMTSNIYQIYLFFSLFYVTGELNNGLIYRFYIEHVKGKYFIFCSVRGIYGLSI